MASTTETTNLGLTIYQTDDKPTYLVDHNENMQKIDAAYGEVKTAADSADAKATSAGNLAQAASEAVGTAVDKANCAMASASAVAGTADQALTTANTAHQVAESAMDLADSASDDANQALNKLGELVNIDDIIVTPSAGWTPSSSPTFKVVNGLLTGGCRYHNNTPSAFSFDMNYNIPSELCLGLVEIVDGNGKTIFTYANPNYTTASTQNIDALLLFSAPWDPSWEKTNT